MRKTIAYFIVIIVIAIVAQLDLCLNMSFGSEKYQWEFAFYNVNHPSQVFGWILYTAMLFALAIGTAKLAKSHAGLLLFVAPVLIGTFAIPFLYTVIDVALFENYKYSNSYGEALSSMLAWGTMSRAAIAAHFVSSIILVGLALGFQYPLRKELHI